MTHSGLADQRLAMQARDLAEVPNEVKIRGVVSYQGIPMHHYTYLIIGGGMTADAVEGIRQADPQSTIGLIVGEPHPPYDQPPLPKGLWKGKPFESIWLQIAVGNRFDPYWIT